MSDKQKDLKFMRRPEVQATTGLSRSSIYALMAKGSFPRPVRLSARSVGWIHGEIQQWLKNKVSATREGGVQ